MTNLRTMWGVDIKIIENRFGESLKIILQKEIKKWINKNYVINEKNNFKLSQEGKIFSNQISSDMFLID